MIEESFAGTRQRNFSWYHKTMAKKNVGLQRRLRYFWSWVTHPRYMIYALLLMVSLLSLLGLANPCGRGSYPKHGICTNGETVLSPLAVVVIGTVIAMLFLVIIMLSEPYTPGTSTKSTQKRPGIIELYRMRFRRSPKWRKRWYPPTFITVYALLLLFGYYVLDGNAGLHWYNYTAQAVLALCVASLLTPLLIAGLRGR